MAANGTTGVSHWPGVRTTPTASSRRRTVRRSCRWPIRRLIARSSPSSGVVLAPHGGRFGSGSLRFPNQREKERRDHLLRVGVLVASPAQGVRLTLGTGVAVERGAGLGAYAPRPAPPRARSLTTPQPPVAAEFNTTPAWMSIPETLS